jgi:hypothetical protein
MGNLYGFFRLRSIPSRVPLHTPRAAQAVNLGIPSDQKEASAGKEEEPTEAYQQGRKVVATKRTDHTIILQDTSQRESPMLRSVRTNSTRRLTQPYIGFRLNRACVQLV